MTNLSTMGGMFVALVLMHFVADRLMQTESMAKRKADESTWMLVVHSAAYSAAFVPVLYLAFRGSVHMTVSSALTLMISHGAIDTYTPIWLWARFVHRPQDMKDDPVSGFTLWCSKPYGFFLTSEIDVVLHAFFLIPIAAMVAISSERPEMARVIGLVSFFASIGFAAASVATVLFMWKRKPAKAPPSEAKVAEAAEEDDEYDRPSMPSQHDE